MRANPILAKKGIMAAVIVAGLTCAWLSGCRAPVEHITETTLEEKTEEAAGGDEIVIITEEEDPQEERDNQLKQILDQMTLEEKVGQMFIARCPQENGEQTAADYCLGGYLLFARDFEGKSSQEAAETIASYQKAASYPMLIGVDEEGGTVNRISRFPQYRDQPFASPQELYAQGGLELVRQDTLEKSQLLKSLGINLNFAPVCDVSGNPNAFMYSRTLGKGGEETADYVKTVVSAMQESGIGSVLKHFPGYGDNGDSHTAIVYDTRPLDSFWQSDFLPFQAGIQAGADVVLTAHNIVQAMDSQYPASLSEKVHHILREELGFQGVIVTDDLSMEGVRQFTGDEEAAVLAVKAGNDLLCCTDFELQVPAVIQAVKEGEISEERINESVLRILRLKASLGLIPLEE